MKNFEIKFACYAVEKCTVTKEQRTGKKFFPEELFRKLQELKSEHTTQNKLNFHFSATLHSPGMPGMWPANPFCAEGGAGMLKLRKGCPRWFAISNDKGGGRIILGFELENWYMQYEKKG